MGFTQSSRVYPISLPSLAPVAQDVIQHFKAQGFEVQGEETLTGGWSIDVRKGGTFKSVAGLKLALKIEIEPEGPLTRAKAGAGIAGRALVFAAAAYLPIFYPVLLTQLWGLIRQSKLDDQALDLIAASLAAHSGGEAQAPAPSGAKFCPACGQPLKVAGKFCPECGQSLSPAPVG